MSSCVGLSQLDDDYSAVGDPSPPARRDPTKPGKWMDPVTGKERLRIDPGHIDKYTGLPFDNPNAAAPHHHGYDPSGRNPVCDPNTGDKHFPTRQE